MGQLLARQQLKSIVQGALITQSELAAQDSLEVPADLLAAVDLWCYEKVLVSSIDSGVRLETTVTAGPSGTGEIIVKGGAAQCLRAGERVTIMAFAWSATPVTVQCLVCGDANVVLRVDKANSAVESADASNSGDAPL